MGIPIVSPGGSTATTRIRHTPSGYQSTITLKGGTVTLRFDSLDDLRDFELAIHAHLMTLRGGYKPNNDAIAASLRGLGIETKATGMEIEASLKAARKSRP